MFWLVTSESRTLPVAALSRVSLRLAASAEPSGKLGSAPLASHCTVSGERSVTAKASSSRSQGWFFDSGVSAICAARRSCTLASTLSPASDASSAAGFVLPAAIVNNVSLAPAGMISPPVSFTPSGAPLRESLIGPS